MTSSGMIRTRCAGRRRPSVRRATICSTAVRPTIGFGGRFRQMGDLVVVGNDRQVLGDPDTLLRAVLGDRQHPFVALQAEQPVVRHPLHARVRI